MTKKVTFNGIELSSSSYDKTAQTLFDYLDDVKKDLENGLDKEDGDIQLSLNLDFVTNKPPQHSIQANGGTRAETKERVSEILKSSAEKDYKGMSGSVKVNLKIEDK